MSQINEKLKALIVDDEKEICEILKSHLEDAAVDVTTVYSGNKAIELLSSNGNFNWVISDIRMEDGCGLELMKYIHSKKFDDLSAIFITGYSNDQLEKELMDLGAHSVLKKPISFEMLVDEIVFSK